MRCVAWFVDLASDGAIIMHLLTHGCVYLPHLSVCDTVKMFLYNVYVCYRGRWRERQLYFAWLLQSARHPTGAVSINAVIYKWHALETGALSGRTASEVDCLCTAQMQMIKIYLYLCVEAFHGTVAEKATQNSCCHIIYFLGRYLHLIYFGWNVTYLVTNLHHLAFSNLCPNCHPVSP